jgi:hypothetical protein
MKRRLFNLSIYAALFLASVGYARALQWWSGHYPESFDDLTWLTVVVGVGYVLLGLRVLLSLDAWLRVCSAFAVACLPIIARSVWNHARNRRLVNSRLERGG